MKRLDHEVPDYLWDRIQKIMKEEDLSVSKDLTQFLRDKLEQSLNRKHTEDYMMHFGYIRKKTECLKCGKVLEVADYALQAPGMAVCQECHAKRWTTPAIEAKELKKMELQSDLRALDMDVNAKTEELNQLRREITWAKQIQSFELECQKKKEELRYLNTEIAGYKVQVEWHRLEDVLPEVLKKFGTSEQKEFFERLKAMKNNVEIALKEFNEQFNEQLKIKQGTIA